MCPHALAHPVFGLSVHISMYCLTYMPNHASKVSADRGRRFSSLDGRVEICSNTMTGIAHVS